MSQTEQQRRHLISGLVGDRQYEYHNSAHFYHSINALADMLPLWVDGIAVESSRVDQNMEAKRRMLERKQ